MDAKAFSLYCPCRTSMDTRRLHTFVAVAECGSVSEAARRLHIAQPALSRQLQALEAELRTKLLVRSGKGVTLTPAGERLFPYALSVLRQLDAVPEIVADSETKVSGRVAIGLPTTASAVLSKPLLLAAAKELPNVQMHLVESLSGHLTDLVHMGKLDLSLLYDPEPSPHLNLEGILIEELGLSGAAHALPTGLSHIRLDELADYPLAIPASSHSLRRLLDTVSIRHGIRLNIALEVDSLAVTKSVIEDGQYFAILAPAAIHQELAAGRLRNLPIVKPRVIRSVALASSAVRGQTSACQAIGRLTLRIARELLESGVWRGTPHSAG
jgi:LysR family nitrogen assimilation transcriptional regulator